MVFLIIGRSRSGVFCRGGLWFGEVPFLPGCDGFVRLGGFGWRTVHAPVDGLEKLDTIFGLFTSRGDESIGCGWRCFVGLVIQRFRNTTSRARAVDI
jgi:hypothetical protein